MWRVDLSTVAINQAARFLADDIDGMRALMEALDDLAKDAQPPTSFAFASPDVRRLRAGRYRVLYEIHDDVVHVRRIARTAR